ncbi:MAG: hypothetical protein Q6363_007785 [Candidatus Njordarchaeota archaeon]
MSLSPQKLKTEKISMKPKGDLARNDNMLLRPREYKDILLRYNILIRPWMKKNKLTEWLGISRTEINELLKNERIDKREISELRMHFKKKRQAAMQALENIKREFRPFYLGMNDFLSPEYLGLLPHRKGDPVVPFTERFGDLRMYIFLGDIIRRNLRSLYVKAIEQQKRLYKRIFKSLKEGVPDEAILTAYSITPKELEEAKKIYKELGGDVSKFSVKATPEEKKIAREFGDMVYEKMIPDELKKIRLCPAYASNDKTQRGMQRMICDIDENGKFKHFSPAVYNIPFYNYSPPKRLQIAAHAIAKNKGRMKLLYGEFPKVPAIRNDIAGEGVNLKLKLALAPKLFKKTYGGGVVITKAAAKKFRYVFTSVKKKAYAATEDGFVPEGTYVKRGDPVVTVPLKDVGTGIASVYSPFEGKVHWLGPPKKHVRQYGLVYYTRPYVIIREAELQVGDKIMSRTGIKGVVTDIIPGKEPIIYVNPTDVWADIPEELEKKAKELMLKQADGKKLTEEEKLIIREYKKKLNKRKAALLLEQKMGDGYVFIFPDPEHIAANYASNGVKMSWTFLMGALEKEKPEKLWKQFYFVGKELQQLLKVLHLKLVRDPKDPHKYRLVLDEKEPKPDEYGEVIDYEHTVAWGTKKAKTYKKIYIPLFLKFYYIDHQGQVRKMGIDASMSEAEKKATFHPMRKFILRRIYELMFKPRYMLGIDRHAVAADVAPDEVLLDAETAKALGVKEGDLVTVRKEPVTTSSSILTLKVRIDHSGKYKYVIGLHPITAEKATIDFDGDTVALFVPPLSREFMPKLSKEDLKKLKPVKFEISDADIMTMYKDDEALAKAVREYNIETRRQDDRDIKKYGALRKKMFTLVPLPEKYSIDIARINEALDIEQVMKAKTRDIETYRKLKKVEKELIGKKKSQLLRIFMQKKIKNEAQIIGLELDDRRYLDRMILYSLTAGEKLFKGKEKEKFNKKQIEMELETLNALLTHIKGILKEGGVKGAQARVYKKLIFKVSKRKRHLLKKLNELENGGKK